MGNDVKSGPEKSFEKPQNYACQICRATREICERCQSVGYLLHMEPPPVVSPVRRGRPRPSLSVYN